MNAWLCRILDKVAIHFAAAGAPSLNGRSANLDEARAFLESDNFISREVSPAKVEFGNGSRLTFASPRPTAYPQNNVVHGRLYRAERVWQERPTMILLHGWNDVTDHYWCFPRIARQLNQRGINAATLEAPYHFQRRPRQLGTWSNFLCPDIHRTLQAAAQAIAEIQSFAEWLRQEGCPSVGLWGISLGAWLAGLAACHDPRWAAVVLVVPVAQLDTVIERVEFCRHIRESLRGHAMDTGRLNLTLSRPVIPTKNILLIEAEHDLFITKASVEELWNAWQQPEIWRLSEGHISVLTAKGLSERVIRWASPRLIATLPR